MTEKEQLIKLIDEKMMEQLTFKNLSEVLAEHLLADGWIKPPCKIGDKVWYITNGKIDNAEVVCIDCRNSGNHIIAHKYTEETEEIKKLCVYFSDVNKIVYLTKEEAENALKGGEKG